MSRITRYWKRNWRPAVINALRHRTGVPVPIAAVSAAAYAAERPGSAAGGRDIVNVSLPPCESLPSRSISGDPGQIVRTLARITTEAARTRYLAELQGVRSVPDEKFVAIVDGGRATHTSGVVITPDDRVLLGATGLEATTENPTNPLQLRYLPRATPVPGRLAMVTCSMPYNYYHWVMEALPRLALYERAGVAVDRYYAPLDTRFQRETLALLGIDSDRIVRANRNRHVVAGQLIASSWQSTPARYKTEFLHHRFTAGLDRNEPQSLRIFISRRRRGRRMIVDEERAFAALAPLGFCRVDLETMSVAEQVAVFYKAECVVGAHGAGMTNIVFCRPGAKVLEVNTPYRTSALFHALAHHRNLDYHLHVADPVHDRRSHFDGAMGLGDSNMRVAPATLATLVRDFLDGKPLPRLSLELGRPTAA